MTTNIFKTEQIVNFEKRATDFCEAEGYSFKWSVDKASNKICPRAIKDSAEYELLDKNGIFIDKDKMPSRWSYPAVLLPVGVILEQEPGKGNSCVGDYNTEYYAFEGAQTLEAMLLVERHFAGYDRLYDYRKAQVFYEPTLVITAEERKERISRLFRTAKAYYTTSDGEVKYPLWINGMYIGDNFEWT